MDSICYLYWLHRPCHIDMLTEGYIGITNNPGLRFKQHIKNARSSKRNHRLYNSLKQHNDFKLDILLVSDRGTCLDLEFKLRPTANIGMNHSSGGNYTPEKEITITTKEKLRLAAKNAYLNDPTLRQRCGERNRGRILTEDQKAKIRQSSKDRGLAWENSLADHDMWLLAESMYSAFNDGLCQTYYSLSKKFNYPVYKTKTIFNMFKAGWNPFIDKDYQNYKRKNIKCQ